MKLGQDFLRSLVETQLSIEEIGDTLTMLGLELEEIQGDVLDIAITANRGDAPCVLGMARELLAKDLESKPTDLYKKLAEGYSLGDEGETEAASFASVELQTEACPRYAFRIIEDVQNGESPAWLKEHLEACGQRPISLLVDLTNFVMLETGQPLHAFDLDTLSGSKIVVRQASDAETITTLDGEDRKLHSGVMVIADAEKPIALAGIMGGAETEVGPGTKRILLESAHFDALTVRRGRTSLGISTEASYRFERGVDPEGVVRALNRFVDLYKEITGKSFVPGVVDETASIPKFEPVELRPERISELMGFEISRDEIVRTLKRLGFDLSVGGRILATPPSWRFDIVHEEDLVEEVGRVIGYEKIPEAMPEGTTLPGGLDAFDRSIAGLRQAMIRAGFSQTVSHSLRGEHALDAPTDRVSVRNPGSPEAALLRNSLSPCLAEAAARREGEGAHLFETGRVFRQEAQTVEEIAFAALTFGPTTQAHWTGSVERPADFFSLKGALESAFLAIGHRIEVREAATSDERLHPNRQAEVFVGEDRLGVMGEVHPAVAEATALPERAVLAELRLEPLRRATPLDPNLRTLSRNPAVRRDIAVVIEKAVPYRQIEAAIAEACGDLLERQWLFDVYEGKGIDEGSHSLAIALKLRAFGENLTDDAANEVRDRAVAALESLGARLR